MKNILPFSSWLAQWGRQTAKAIKQGYDLNQLGMYLIYSLIKLKDTESRIKARN